MWTPNDQPGVRSTYLKAHLGGTLVGIDCDDWERPGDDTLLTRAVVPVEPEDHARYMEAARQASDFRHASEFRHPIMALVNFPGEKTEACLEEIIARYPNVSRRDLAEDVLHFFLYHLEPMGRENQALFGRWRLEGHRELIDITFTRDQTFVATAFERPRHEREGPRHLWDGQGYWIVRDGHLSIMRTHVRVGLAWYDGGRELFRSKKIERIKPAEVVLDGGPPMKRRS